MRPWSTLLLASAAALGGCSRCNPDEAPDPLKTEPTVSATVETTLEPEDAGPDAADADADAAAAASAAASAALDALVAMRDAEGAHLAADLGARLDAMAATFDALAAAGADAAVAARDRLHERLSRLLGGTAIDPARLAQEVAVLADRADVTEELVRARSHLAQLAATMAQAGAVGRRLDFLVQELGREINTIGSKSTAAPIAQLVVQAKTELEKIREQVQNLE